MSTSIGQLPNIRRGSLTLPEKRLIQFVIITFLIQFFTGMLKWPKALNGITDLYLIYFWIKVFQIKLNIKPHLGLMILIAFGLIGLLKNNFSVFVFLNGLKRGVLYFSIIYYIYYYIKPERISCFKGKIEKLFIYIGMAQLGFNIYIQLFLRKIAIQETTHFFVHDLYTGSLGYGATGVLAIFQTMVIIIIMVKYNKREIKLKKAIFYLIVIILSLAKSEVKVLFVLLPISVVLLLIFSKVRFRVTFSTILFFILTFYGYYYIYTNSESKDEKYMERLFEVLHFSEYGSGDRVGAMSRYFIIEDTYFNLKNSGNLFTGVGMGNVRESSIPGWSGEYFNKIFKYPGTGVSLGAGIIFWEFGILGSLLWLVFYINMYVQVSRGNEEVVLSKIFIFLLLLSNFYTNGHFSVHLATIVFTMYGLEYKRKCLD